jgi:hypothetical protein
LAQGAAGQETPGDTVTRRDLRFVALWAVGILLAYAVGGYLAARQLQDYKTQTERTRQARISGITQALPPSRPGREGRSAAAPTEVSVGVYVHRIGDFSIREAAWTADFDIWFRWTGDQVSPGQTFQIANGRTDLRERREVYAKGGVHYERYRVTARITKYFEALRFPFGDQGLSIEVEDGAHDIRTLRYVADEHGSGFSRSGIPPQLRVTRSLSGVGQEVYGSSRGDPRVPAGSRETYSRYAFAMLARPPSGLLFLTMFQALFASVAVAMLAAFIRPVYGDGRFGIGIGAFFAAVANNIFVGTFLPPSTPLTLAGMVNAFGLVTIGFTLIQSVISLHYFDVGKVKLSDLFDHVSFGVLLLAYVVVSLLLPLAAR